MGRRPGTRVSTRGHRIRRNLGAKPGKRTRAVRRAKARKSRLGLRQRRRDPARQSKNRWSGGGERRSRLLHDGTEVGRKAGSVLASIVIKDVFTDDELSSAQTLDEVGLSVGA